MTQDAAIDRGTASQPEVIAFFDEPTNTLSYIVKDPASNACSIIDPVMNLDYPSGTISSHGADQIISYVVDNNLDVAWVLDTHIHADHLSAAQYIKERLGGALAIGFNVPVIQKTFGKIFNSGRDLPLDGSQFDVLLTDGTVLDVGEMKGYAIHTPGHTPACMSFIFGDAVFVGDTLFMPDTGTARADFPGGDAATLFQSIQRILSFDSAMRVFVCHDYCSQGRDMKYQTTIHEQQQSNIHVNVRVTEAEFIAMREQRDATLGMPTLMLPSLQVNIRAGHLPPAESTGQVFLKLPINAFSTEGAEP